MTGFKLSINTNPLVNRVAGVDALIECIANEIRCEYIQLTPEFLNPSWPAPVLRRMVREINAAMDRTGVRVTSIMTSTFLRLNHFGHPDAELRQHYVEWFKILTDLAVDIGAQSIGSQFAILTSADWNNLVRRQTMIQASFDGWRAVAEHGKKKGLSFLYWEPMSIGREFGHTIADTAALQKRLEAEKFSLPMRLIVDIDHGDVTSNNPDDIDPYAWAAAFPRKSPIIHVKQSSANKGGHWPFTPEHNANGHINPARLLEAIKSGGGTDNEICLELSFREREPYDSSAVKSLAKSVAYWAPHIKTAMADKKFS